MPSIFKTRKPKQFEIKSHYSGNERRDYLESRKRAIMYEQGLISDEQMPAEELIKGHFVEGTTHLRRRLEKDEDDPGASKRRMVRLGVWLLVAIVVLLWLFRETSAD